MPKDETASGLLSKVVKFVRNPGTNWADLDSIHSDKDDAVSKQLLKEMIERKRRNDFVRKREFDMLRKMRKREAMGGLVQDPAGRPSFFQSSLASRPDDRATTLKKIDEIEAQMSMQWWKTKSNTAAGTTVEVPLMPQGEDAATQAPVDSGLPVAYRPTTPVGLTAVGNAAEVGAKPGQAGMPVRDSAVDAAEMVVYDAELEESAIRFANGDNAGAEAGLLEILRPGGARTDHAETWLALFDLYRATGAQEKFETAALQFVERFDRSAPQWFVLSDVNDFPGGPAAPAGNGPAADWVCPSVVGVQTVAALRAALGRAPMPWRLDWNHLKTIEAAALEPLCAVFSGWADQPVQLRFIGDAQLQNVLFNATPSGNRSTAQSCWLLRLEALRVTHRPDDFELAALDFCVTYEVSPPAWVSARCEYASLDAQGAVVSGHTVMGDAYRDSTHSSFSLLDGDSDLGVQSSTPLSNLLSAELSGQIRGDAISVLDQLEARFTGVDMVQISCAKLVRVDFSAAGTLLNWVSAREAENCAVQFSDVNRLVASFFNVIGITEHARVRVRLD
ncbi:STAS domain-containing protein [Polaromonas sp. OV174]|uniref:STAS domain-containing protein n=1 Tax=Polaromonas sp. OV174 TaxID=1855300 RepID=UPI0008EAD9CC|nr:STAS domain-containing protein [Polaromonas sp. OV174]SFB67192.1 STAS domain-containing protein [Polaromonas sp. OV174]